MPSLIPGYEYDIFISYRHNDNLDGWVTDLLEKLEKELRGTLKDSVTIYFDKSPNDGLLETHHVDKSLEGKLKCLIFIPIISQTYCDTKSFAWQHEFVAFNRLAKEDPFGRDIKLGNGNVASRILPIKIHDLDAEDKALLEKEIEGALRTIEFIFKSAGVNRPLRSNEDHPQDNLNKTFYRDQVNKVANAIKEIIRGMKEGPVQVSKSQTILSSRTDSPGGSKLMGFAMGAVVLACLAIATWYFMGPSPGKKVTEELAIAVLPFQNLSGDKDQEYFNDGLTDDITDRLAKIKELRVISRTSVVRYKNNPPPIPQIGRELNVGYILEGSVRRQGNQVKIVAQLINAKTDEHLWSETIERDASDIFKIQAEIANTIARYLKLSLSVNELGELANIPTQSMEAYDLFLKGKADSSIQRTAIDRRILNFRKATALDPEFAEAYGELAGCFRLKGEAFGERLLLDSALIQAVKAIQLKPSYATGYFVLGQTYAAKDQWEIAKGYLLKSHRLQPGLGFERLTTYMRVKKHRLDSAVFYIVNGIRYHPRNAWAFIRFGETLRDLGLYDSAIWSYEKAGSLNGELDLRRFKAGLLIRMQQYDQAIDYCKSIIAVDTTRSLVSISKMAIAAAYAFKGDWTNVVSYLEINGLAEHELMALALLKTGRAAGAKNIIKNKREAFTKNDNKEGLAFVAILENDFTTAAKILDDAYSNYELTPGAFDLNPFYKELSNTKEYKTLMARIEAERTDAFASIKAMKLH